MDKLSFVRLCMLIVALTNQLLAVFGKSPLPIEGEQAELLFSTLFTLVVAAQGFWKNNYLSKHGKRQKAVLKANNLYKK